MDQQTTEKKKPMCPLMTVRDPRGIGHVVTACQQDRCSWWVEDKQKCAITVLGGTKR